MAEIDYLGIVGKGNIKRWLSGCNISIIVEWVVLLFCYWGEYLIRNKFKNDDMLIFDSLNWKYLYKIKVNMVNSSFEIKASGKL